MASRSKQHLQELHLPDIAMNTRAWEDWLRWDPTLENFPSDGSSKDSGDSPFNDGSVQDGMYPWMPLDDTLASPLDLGDDSSFLTLDPSAMTFSSHESDDAFVFGAGTLPPADSIAEASTLKQSAPWPSAESSSILQAPQLLLPLSDRLRLQQGISSTASSVSSRPSPDLNSHSSATSPSPQPVVPAKKKVGRKRKSELVAADATNQDGEPPVKKTSHNVIEKRYRNNLNDKILELRDSVPSLRAMSKPGGEDEDFDEDLEGLAPAHKLNKSTIMAKATEYIRHLEKRNKSISDEMDALKARMAALEEVQRRNSENSNLASRRQSISYTDFGDMQTAFTPESQLRQRSSLQQPLSAGAESTIDDQPIDSSRQRHSKSRNKSNAVGKLMVGTMAGLMALEGYSEQHAHDGTQALFAAPMHLFRRGTLSSESSSSSVMPLLKISLIFGALLYLILPLFKRSPETKARPQLHIVLTAAPSLSSPVEIRRKAWLTAIQSVWTPKHFLLEVVAVTVRIAGMSVRRAVGFDRYAVLFGMSKEDEAARIKAWDIAIDAQLAGGDAEVSYYRLLLTLMASGTLPDSPMRLMQKAVHFRIFFWEVANAGYGNLFLFKDFTARVARVYWDSARLQQKALAAGSASQVDEVGQSIDLLPDHLAALIELECDEVLTDDMIPRAYNLAWNRPQSEDVESSATLNNVVEDPAIRSPLDAVAAWFTNSIVDEALAMSVRREASSGNDVEYLINLAASTAPPASSTLTRAYVAKAVLVDKDRERNIAAALESIPQTTAENATSASSPTTVHLNVVNHVPLTREVRSALTLAKLLSFTDGIHPGSSHSHAALVLEQIPVLSRQLSLLTAVASYKVLDSFAANPFLFSHAKNGLERLAVNLRSWVGTRAGKVAGLQREEKDCIADRCFTITRRLAGWKEMDEADSGYGSSLSRRVSDETLVS